MLQRKTFKLSLLKLLKRECLLLKKRGLMKMSNPFINILKGVQEQAQARQKVAENKAEAMHHQENAGQAEGTESTPETMQELSPAEMNQAIQVLSKAVMELTAKLEGKEE